MPIGFIDLADAIGKLITDSIGIISNVTEQVDKAIVSGIAIYDKIRLQNLRRSLERIEGEMSSVNAKKKTNIDTALDYLNHEPFAPDWASIRASWDGIYSKLADLISHLGADDTTLVRSVGLETASDLKGDLEYQSTIYQRLSTLPEPQTDEERNKLASIINKLSNLRDNVLTLESAIWRYLQKFE
jgi:hypothetical protein